MPQLSVVIPTFNTGAMTLRCCRAVLATMPADTEVIVVDDGSSDGTADLLARTVPGIVVHRMAANSGFAIAANTGTRLSAGRIILLLNSDALVEADALSALLEAFARDPKLGVAGAQLLDPDGTPQWSGGHTPTLPWIAGVVSGAGHLARILRRGSPGVRHIDWVSGAAMAIRREAWESAGPLDERYRFYCQDIDLCLKASAAGWKVSLVPEARVIHGMGQTIADGTELRQLPERLWPDLLDWGRGHHGRWWALRARAVLIVAASLRIIARTVRRPLRRDATTASMIRALRSLLGR